MNGRVVISTAGHDAGKLYIIVGKDNGRLFLADGIKNKLTNPKKKNEKHVSFLKEETVTGMDKMIADKSRGCDDMIRRMLHHLKKKNPEYK